MRPRCRSAGSRRRSRPRPPGWSRRAGSGRRRGRRPASRRRCSTPMWGSPCEPLKQVSSTADRPCRSRYRQALSTRAERRYPRVMDARNEVRQFLTSRRAKLTPEQAGLPTFGSGPRGGPGVRREEGALLAGVSVDYYTRLERGNLGGVSETVLDALARALQLDEPERAHLFNLARAVHPTTRGRRRTATARVRPVVQQLLDSLVGAPAYVRNG